ncbi:thiol peroxidase [Plebeiibacterium marinum]|uniref:Thiol peroxidase n=1 Tax=Plebeiibacterium marinum TaxID=2992111 RepID=A0AAE3MC18_9BACT|nr:thiol peroxidase [Plebeiobacterium marinum]MCW3804691.1 thiol peroxidase [Plebeiobacterium marinum]
MNKTDLQITFAGNPVTIVGNKINVGDKAPDFTVINEKLEPVKLSDYDGKVKVLVIYPSIDTGVCAAQNRRFNVEANNLKDVVVLSISVDLPFAQSRFCGAEGLENIITLSDHKDLDFGEKYGFVIDEFRLLTRGTVIIDKDNTVKYVEYVPEITNDPDYDGALNAAKELI